MVASQEVFDALKSIGLNLYERKIFVALLAKGIATAGEVSELAKVPRSRSYDILESLADKGFVVPQPSKPMKYVALQPKEALERAKENMQNRHLETLERMERIKDSPIISELENIYKNGFSMVQPFEMAGILKGRYPINQQLKQLFKNAKQNISMIVTEECMKDLHSKHLKLLKRKGRSGVKVKILSNVSDNNLAKIFSEVGEMKTASTPAGRMFIVDNEHFVIGLTDEKTVHHTQDVAFWSGSGHFVKDVLSPMFEQAWANGK